MNKCLINFPHGHFLTFDESRQLPQKVQISRNSQQQSVHGITN
ncbi:hypothetical protein HMPREF0201_04666 [Cedecea davisae DSM 4568]|uniref:Uncharacterized protein n=1 Tax=Cedecea davisae DSM 4568 TaxID=566551 RepID=S3IGS3_9ENTR|nr:hypothetical protein HMPREF0201_04666 [Cedecea davisae DSM 4568]